MPTTKKEIKIRKAKPEDAEELLKIYAPYVEHTAVSFEYEVPGLEEFRQRIARTLEHHPWLVAKASGDNRNTGGELIGYAYACRFHERAAYSRCVEMSIYVAEEHRGNGVGRALYDELERQLYSQGVLNLYACIAWTDEPNELLTHQSPDFHTHMGYRKCAHFHRCGYKFGRWYDVIWMEKLNDNCNATTKLAVQK